MNFWEWVEKNGRAQGVISKKSHDELMDAKSDLAYKNGFKAGWNACIEGDEKALKSVNQSGLEARRFIKQES